MSAAAALSGDLVLAIDVGLTNCKAVLFDLDGRIVSRMAVPYETRRPTSDRVEQDPEAWWEAAIVAVRCVVAQESRRHNRVVAIGVTAHMHALACVNAK